TALYTLSLHDALPICRTMYRICSSSMAAASSAPVAKIPPGPSWRCAGAPVTTWRTNFEKEICRWNMSSNDPVDLRQDRREWLKRSEEHTSELQSRSDL